MMARSLLLLMVALAAVSFTAGASMKMYKKNPGSNKYRPMMVAVSSTVIPLDELPTYTVSSILGPATEEPPAGVTKPSKPTKLITAVRKKPILPEKKTTITEITKEEFSKH